MTSRGRRASGVRRFGGVPDHHALGARPARRRAADTRNPWAVKPRRLSTRSCRLRTARRRCRWGWAPVPRVSAATTAGRGRDSAHRATSLNGRGLGRARMPRAAFPSAFVGHQLRRGDLRLRDGGAKHSVPRRRRGAPNPTRTATTFHRGAVCPLHCVILPDRGAPFRG
jgi:hypothetical protein